LIKTRNSPEHALDFALRLRVFALLLDCLGNRGRIFFCWHGLDEKPRNAMEVMTCHHPSAEQMRNKD
jgi:hypothetical protein